MIEELPPHLTERDVEQYARNADTLLDFQRSARVGRYKSKRLLRKYDLTDEVEDADNLLQRLKD